MSGQGSGAIANEYKVHRHLPVASPGVRSFKSYLFVNVQINFSA